MPLFRNPLRSEPKSKPEVKSTPLPSVRQSASSLFEQSKAALRARDIDHAYQLFMRAYAQSCDDAHAGSESDAGIMRVNDPKGWLAMLHRAGEKIKALSVDTAIRDQLLRVVNHESAETEQLLARYRRQLENRDAQDRLMRAVDYSLKVRQAGGALEERDFDEMQIAALEAAYLDPRNPLLLMALSQTKLVRDLTAAKPIRSGTEAIPSAPPASEKELKERDTVSARKALVQGTRKTNDLDRLASGIHPSEKAKRQQELASKTWQLLRRVESSWRERSGRGVPVPGTSASRRR